MTPSKPPLTSAAHILPFDKLSPLDFERLCLWLVEREGYARAEHLGLAGSEQGRDVIAYKPAPGGDELWYFQCKRYASIRAKTLKDEVDKYLALAKEKSELRPAGVVFVVSCAVSAKVREEAGAYCSQNGLAHEFWARTELDMRVKQHSDLLAEFFGLQALPNQPKVYHNLPQPDYGIFIGREEELAQVTRILRPYPHSQHALVTIDGIGGVGKSALALEVAHRYLRKYDQLPEKERFDAIIWTSAKSSVLTADGIRPRRQIMRTLDDIYTTIAITLEREDITRARSEEQSGLVNNALTRQRTLLIVDNLETVDDERVNAFLRELPAPTKAIVTTRHRIDTAYPVRLTGMPKEDGLTLLTQKCAEKSVTLTDTDTELLYDRTGGVPLAIVWSVAQMGYGYSVEAVLHRLTQRVSDISQFCFQGVVDCILGTDAHALLMALALFATDAGRGALGYVADLADVVRRDDALVVLEKLSLVNRGGSGRFWMLPLTRQYVIADSLPHVADVNRFRHRQVEYYQQYIPRPGSFLPYSREIVEKVKIELDNILELLGWCKAHKDQQGFLELFFRVHHLLGVFGYLDIREYWGYHAIQIAKDIGSAADLGILYAFTIGWLAIKRAERARARRFLRRGLRFIRQSGDREAESLALRYLGRLEVNEGRTQQALRIYHKALDIAVQGGYDAVAASISADMAYWHMEYGDLEKAEGYVRAAINGFEDVNDAVRASDRTVMLANILVRQGKYGEAEQELLPSLQRLEEELGQPEAVASAYACLAHIRAHEGQLNEARQCYERAKQIYHEIGMRDEVFPIGLPEACQQEEE